MNYLCSISRFLAVRLLLAAAPLAAQAQTTGVGIGTTTPEASAALDIRSTTQGLLLPRLTLAQRTALTASATAPPVPGLVIYQSDNTPGLYAYDGTGWVRLAADNLGNHVATQALNLQGNALTGEGSSVGSAVGVGVTAQGGLNVGQNAPGHTVALGYQAGTALTSGTANQLLGYQAGAALTSGNGNYFSGYQAGYSATGSTFNHFAGYQAGYSTTIGLNNHFSGYQAGYRNTSGHQNTFSGYQAGFNNTIGQENYFSGTYSGFSNTSGSGNYFSGLSSGQANTTGSYNAYSGFHSGAVGRTGSYNFFGGYYSGRSNVSGSFNVALGSNAGPTSASLSNTVAIGSDAGGSCSNCLALGHAGVGALNVGIDTSLPNSTLQVNGSLAIGVAEDVEGDAVGTPLASVSAAYIGMAPAAGANRFLLPDPVTCYRRVYYLRNSSATEPACLLIDSATATFADPPDPNDPAQYFLPGSGKVATAIATRDGWVIIRGS